MKGAMVKIMRTEPIGTLAPLPLAGRAIAYD
jgi:hypothetical protein